MPKKHTQSNKTRKRKGKDLDEILEDLKPEKITKVMNQEVDIDLPGDGQFYCVECSRHFINDVILKRHKATKGIFKINLYFFDQMLTIFSNFYLMKNSSLIKTSRKIKS